MSRKKNISKLLVGGSGYSMNDSFRKWFLNVLPPFVVKFVRKEMLPLYRKIIKFLCGINLSRLQKQASFHPDSAKAQMNLGYAFYRQGNFDESVRCYEKAIAASPDFLEAYLYLELMLRFKNQERKTDSKGNLVFDDRNHDLDKNSFDRILSCCQKMIEKFPDSMEANFRMGNVLLAARGNPEKASWFFHKATKLRIEQARREGRVGPIFVASMHRSATGFMRRSLISGLGLPSDISEAAPCSGWGYPNVIIPEVPPYALRTAPVPDALSVSHTAPLPQNLLLLNVSVDRMIVNVRDPRQGLISYVHYIKHHFRRTNNIGGLIETHIPEDYFLMSLTEQIDWQIENFYLPVTIKWIEGWVDAEADPSFYPDILFTTQENLVRNPRKHFESILEFYGFDTSRFIFPDNPEFKANTTMRAGKTDEWLRDFTEKQKEKASRMIPEKLYEKFHWPK